METAALIVAVVAILVALVIYLLQTSQTQRSVAAIFSTIEQIYQGTVRRREAEELAVQVGADIWRSSASPKYAKSSGEIEIHLTADIGHTPNYCELECIVENPEAVPFPLRLPIDSGKPSQSVTVRYPKCFGGDASLSKPGRYDITWYAYDAFDGDRHKVATDSFFVLPWDSFFALPWKLGG